MVKERLALAHEHNVGYFSALGVVRESTQKLMVAHVLPEDLSRRQIAEQLLGAGVTEGTV